MKVTLNKHELKRLCETGKVAIHNKITGNLIAEINIDTEVRGFGFAGKPVSKGAAGDSLQDQVTQLFGSLRAPADE